MSGDRPPSVYIDRAAELLGVSRRTVYNMIRDGRLQTIRSVNGRARRVLVESVDLQRRANPVPALEPEGA